MRYYDGRLAEEWIAVRHGSHELYEVGGISLGLDTWIITLNL